MKNKGITLIALIVTIIILLILAGITIGTIAGENGIIKQSNLTKEQAEISEEKEQIEVALVQVIGKNKYGNFKEDELQKELDNNVGNDRTTVIDNVNTLLVKFVDSNRYYEIDNEGNVSYFNANRYEDSTPGELTQNSDGQYMIESIEDLVVFSAMVNGGYSDDKITIPANQFTGESVILMCDLDFCDIFSYNDYSTTLYNKYLGIEDNDIDLRKALIDTSYKGFIPIGYFCSNSNRKDFCGTFDGKNNNIKNIYINSEQDFVGLFGSISGDDSVIKDIGITGKIIAINGNAGGLAGRVDLNAKFINCSNSCNVIAENGCAGGIIGHISYSPISIYNSCNVGSIEAERVGGILGRSYGFSRKC